MKISAIRTEKILPPQQDIYQILEDSIKVLKEKSIVAISSKIVAIHQGRTVKIVDGINKDKLAKKEADLYLEKDFVPGEHILFTIKDNLIVASSGIDKSNADGYLVLWPKDSYGFAKQTHNWLRRKFSVKDVGVIVTDSHVFPMRRGTIGMSLGHFGFNPIKSYIGKPDIFGKPMKVSVANHVDSLAIASVFAMGEGSEQTPIVLIDGVEHVDFSTNMFVNSGEELGLEIPMEDDLFSEMLSAVPWKKGGGGL